MAAEVLLFLGIVAVLGIGNWVRVGVRGDWGRSALYFNVAVCGGIAGCLALIGLVAVAISSFFI